MSQFKGSLENSYLIFQHIRTREMPTLLVSYLVVGRVSYPGAGWRPVGSAGAGPGALHSSDCPAASGTEPSSSRCLHPVEHVHLLTEQSQAQDFCLYLDVVRKTILTF